MIICSFPIEAIEPQGLHEELWENCLVLEGLVHFPKTRGGSQLVSSVSDENMSVIRTEECFAHHFILDKLLVS